MSTRVPAPPPELPGFRYLELLGTGGFADVFQYEQLGLGRKVAVKVLLSDIDADVQASFEVESSVMAKLSNHPSIVSIYQAGITPDGRPFLVMEYCPPPHLALRLRARPLTVTKGLEVAIQLCGAVETAHRLGILHRDIKPANILFTEFGRAALTDFGISVTTAGAQSGEGFGMSVPWAPPEQLAVGAPMGPSGDVYSLAATLYTALVGRAPFNVPGGANDAVAMAPRVRTMPLPPTRRPDVPDSLERTLRTAMAKAPHERYESALVLARALQAIQAELHHPVTTIDVLDEQVIDVGAPEDGGGTRLSGFVSIDPEPAPAPLRPAAFPAPTLPPPPAAWAPTAPAAPFVPQPEPVLHLESQSDLTARPSASPPATITPAVPTAEPPAGGARSISPAMIAAAVVVAAVIVGVVLLGRGSPDATTGNDNVAPKNGPQDPIDNGDDTPAAPDKVTVRTDGRGQISVSWTAPFAESGDRYIVQPLDRTDQSDPDYVLAVHGGATPITGTTTVLTTDETCAAVWSVRGTHRSKEKWGCAN
ncbi:serine/threonine protein kinase [Nocardioides humilatus]|uniref:non-specific serine/threonine protein kinase n=1 Tax=Nocardioides humilatus TaxID=2607660 RepID=A0A5B1LP53_9ACTN|nr:serine/threonine-protein kinase [Nocardioides humilatus]KAA1421550.1 serine/threonine protein kinase [Nocardioides humilatus]